MLSNSEASDSPLPTARNTYQTNYSPSDADTQKEKHEDKGRQRLTLSAAHRPSITNDDDMKFLIFRWSLSRNIDLLLLIYTLIYLRMTTNISDEALYQSRILCGKNPENIKGCIYFSNEGCISKNYKHI